MYWKAQRILGICFSSIFLDWLGMKKRERIGVGERGECKGENNRIGTEKRKR